MSQAHVCTSIRYMRQLHGVRCMLNMHHVPLERRACVPQALKDALAAEKAARAALAGEVAKLKARTSTAEGRRGPSAGGKENVAV